MVAMGPQDTYVVKMEHLVTRTRVRGELAPSHRGQEGGEDTRG